MSCPDDGDSIAVIHEVRNCCLMGVLRHIGGARLELVRVYDARKLTDILHHIGGARLDFVRVEDAFSSA